MNSQVKGTIAGILSASTYGCSPALALLLYATSFDAANALFYRYLGALVLFLPFLIIKRENLLLPWRDFLKLGIPSLCFALSTLTYFISFGYMNAGISATILFLYPVFTAVIMVLAYHEKIRPAMIFAIVLSFAGVVMLHGAEAGGLSPIGTALAVISAFTYALYIVAINRTKIIISNNKLTFYLVFFSVATTAIYMAVSPNSAIMLPHLPEQYLYIALLAIVPTIISLLLMNISIAAIGSTATAVLGAMEPVTAVALSVIIFGEHLSFSLLCGIALILLGVMIVIVGQRFKVWYEHMHTKYLNRLAATNGKKPRKRWRWKS